MRTVVELFGALVLLAAVGLAVYAFTLPNKFALDTASALQVTQVYSQATLYAVLSVGLFVFAGVLVLAVRPTRD